MSQTLSQQRRDTWPINCTPIDAYASVFFCFVFYTSGTPLTRHIHTHFEFWGGPPSCFFLPFGVTMKEIQSIQLCCHISFLSFVQLTTCFFSSCRQLLDSCKCRLFCLHIQHVTRCLFEQWTLVGSAEAAVCGFCLSVSLHLRILLLIVCNLLWCVFFVWICVHWIKHSFFSVYHSAGRYNSDYDIMGQYFSHYTIGTTINIFRKGV